MYKETSRDYITAAMQLYAANGKPNLTELAEKGYQTHTYLDMECVIKTLTYLTEKGEASAIRAIERVYFLPPYTPLKSTDIAGRVRAAAREIPADERSVYRWLKNARVIAADFRGLRT